MCREFRLQPWPGNWGSVGRPSTPIYAETPRPDDLPLHHAAVTGCRGGTPTRVAALAIYALAGAVRSRGVVRQGMPGRQALEAQTYLDQLCQMDDRITRVYQLTQTFLVIVREHRGSDLSLLASMAQAHRCGILRLTEPRFDLLRWRARALSAHGAGSCRRRTWGSHPSLRFAEPFCAAPPGSPHIP
jgi:hypothetical protein